MNILSLYTAQKIKLSIKDFFSKCDQIRRFLRIWSHLLKKSLMENFIFCTVILEYTDQKKPVFGHILRNVMEFILQTFQYLSNLLTHSLFLRMDLEIKKKSQTNKYTANFCKN